MKYVNNEKQRQKMWLINDLGSSLTNIDASANDIKSIISLLDSMISDLLSNSDKEIISNLKYAMECFISAQKLLSLCRNMAGLLDVYENDGNDNYGNNAYGNVFMNQQGSSCGDGFGCYDGNGNYIGNQWFKSGNQGGGNGYGGF